VKETLKLLSIACNKESQVKNDSQVKNETVK